MPKNLANILTITRLALLPLIILLFYIPFPWAAWVALSLYIIGAITDFFDGWVARKFNQESDFGRLMDPISDKIYVVTLLLLLVATNRIEGIFVICVILILTREFLVSGFREYLAPKGVTLHVTQLAKWKTTVQMIATGLLIIGPVELWAQYLGLGILVAATVMTVISGYEYVKTGLRYLSK